MNNAWERAVEAGARVGSAYAFDDGAWINRGNQLCAQDGAKRHVADILRAAFPILAEELVREAEAENFDAINQGVRCAGNAALHHIGRSEAAITIAKRQRARIEQMKEPS